MKLRLLSVSLFLAASTSFAGCGLVADSFEATLKLEFDVDEGGGTYRNEKSVNPSQYPEVRDNCSSIEKETGQIRSLKIEILQTTATHDAQFGSGEVYMRQGGTSDWPPESPVNAFATFDRVPLVTGQIVTLELTPARRAALAALVFSENCDKPIDVKLVGEADGTHTAFRAQISFLVDFVAGL